MKGHHSAMRLVALAASACAVVGVGSLGGASSAFAACASGGYGAGASLQTDAMQNIWLVPAGWGKNLGACSSQPAITYTGTTSGEALNEFGNNNGVLDPTQDAVANKSGISYKDAKGGVLDWYVGTDTPPDQGQVDNAEIASGDKKGLLEEVTIPVTQSPLAILFSLPAKCTIATGTKIDLDGKTLVEIWEGNQASSAEGLGEIPAQGGYKAATWGALLTQLGIPIVESAGCESNIILQAREGETGASYALKLYLSLASNDLKYNATTEQFETKNIWNGYITDQATWPAPTEQKGNKKASEIVKKTAATPGSVGYSDAANSASEKNGGFTNIATETTLESSASHEIAYAEIEDNEGQVTQEKLTAPVYVNPIAEKPVLESGKHTQFEHHKGTCQSTTPVPTDVKTPYSYTDPWYGITAEEPNIGNAVSEAYPICALTYDLAWHHYNAANLFTSGSQGEEIAATVTSLFEYITGPTGQLETNHDDYNSILTTSTWTSHVALAAESIEG